MVLMHRWKISLEAVLASVSHKHHRSQILLFSECIQTIMAEVFTSRGVNYHARHFMEGQKEFYKSWGVNDDIE